MHRERDDQGQAATELALVVPLVLLLLLAAVQVTLVARDHILVVHAARVAAREAALVDGNSNDEANVRFAASHAGGLKPTRVRTETSYQGWADMVTVELTYRSPTDVPLVGPLFPDVEVRAKATMRLERGHETTRKPDCFRKAAGTPLARGESCERGVSGAPGSTHYDARGPVGPTQRGA